MALISVFRTENEPRKVMRLTFKAKEVEDTEKGEAENLVDSLEKSPVEIAKAVPDPPEALESANVSHKGILVPPRGKDQAHVLVTGSANEDPPLAVMQLTLARKAVHISSHLAISAARFLSAAGMEGQAYLRFFLSSLGSFVASARPSKINYEDMAETNEVSSVTNSSSTNVVDLQTGSFFAFRQNIHGLQTPGYEFIPDDSSTNDDLVGAIDTPGAEFVFERTSHFHGHLNDHIAALRLNFPCGCDIEA